MSEDDPATRGSVVCSLLSPTEGDDVVVTEEQAPCRLPKEREPSDVSDRWRSLLADPSVLDGSWRAPIPRCSRTNRAGVLRIAQVLLDWPCGPFGTEFSAVSMTDSVGT